MKAFNPEKRKTSRWRRQTGVFLWFLLMMAVGWQSQTAISQGAAARISLQSSSDTIVVGDSFYVVVTISSDEEMSGFEGYFSYDQSHLQYVTGGSVASGNDDEIHIQDTERSDGVTRIKYSIQFRARKKGTCTISLKKPYTVYGTDDAGEMSVGASSLSLEILSKRQAAKKQKEQADDAETSDTSMDNAKGNATEDPQGNPPQTTQQGETETEERDFSLGEDIGDTENTYEESGQEAPSVTETSYPATDTQSTRGLSRQTCIIILCFCVAGLVMIVVLAGSLWSSEEEVEEDDTIEDDTSDSSIENTEKPLSSEETLAEIEERLEKKRDWLKK
jgi:hypothetical protein